MVTVCTVLPPPERPRLDAVGDGCFTALHANSFRDALRAARRKRVDALVLSVHSCRGDELPAVARFVREFPAIPAVAPPPLGAGTAVARVVRGRLAAPKGLPRGVAAVPGGLLLPHPRALGGRGGLPPRLLVAAELRSSSQGHAGRHRRRVPPPVPV